MSAFAHRKEAPRMLFPEPPSPKKVAQTVFRPANVAAVVAAVVAPIPELDADALLEGLTEDQRIAVAHVDGPLLVLAGPGSGKTRVITRRVARLVALGIPAWQILALTFTNKAAGEMKHRVESMIPIDVPGRRGLVVSTFHAFCAMFLRRHAVDCGVDPDFVIYDADDQRSAMKSAIVEAGLDTKNFQ
ncbi:MAG: hypothetical protein DWH86_02150, partial [Planctomycetota bacterium]